MPVRALFVLPGVGPCQLPGMKKNRQQPAVFCSFSLERAKGFEPSTPTLARLCSTPELRPRSRGGRGYPAGRARHHSERARVCKRRRRAEPAATTEGISRACRSRSRRRRASDWRHRNGRPDRWRYCHRRRGRRRSAARGSEVSWRAIYRPPPGKSLHEVAISSGNCRIRGGLTRSRAWLWWRP
jgi:hypothetical protein